MNLKAALWLYWGVPSLILGMVIMAVSGLPVEKVMPVAGTAVVVGWVALFAYANLATSNNAPPAQNQVHESQSQQQWNPEPLLAAIKASEQSVLDEIVSFTEHLRAQLPNSADVIKVHLTCYYAGCIEVFRASMLGRGVLAEKAGLVSRLNIYQMHDIISALHAADVISSAATTDDRRYEQVYLTGVASMYRKPRSYVEKWLEFLKQNPNEKAEGFAVALNHQRCEEIAQALGLEIDLIESLFWSEVSVEIGRMSFAVYETFLASGQSQPSPNSS